MCRKKLAKKVYDYLLEHIAELERQKESLVKEYYSDDVVEGNIFESFIKGYISSINSIIGSAEIMVDGKSKCPLAIIGSLVQVEDMNDKETYKYLITPPYSKQNNADADHASCLSPLGKALLFKEINEKVSIEVPAGTLHYIIKSIELPGMSSDMG